MQAFFKKYDYKHEVLCVAADGPSSVAFSFVADTVSIDSVLCIMGATQHIKQAQHRSLNLD